MKKQLIIKLCCAGFILLHALNAKAQVTWPSNTNPTAGQFVGLTAQPFPLTIAHKGNFPINFLTSNINRMVINPSLTSTIRSVAGQVTDGFVGIGKSLT